MIVTIELERKIMTDCCPAVLIENFFQDNREDVEFLLSGVGRQCVTDIAVEGIRNYLRTL
jgi:N-acetylmuramoyl-L-alanine amidase